MALTLADRITLARLVLAPAVVAAYLLLPVEGAICFWVAGLLAGLAEYSDLLDGQIARRRGEVSDFGKLADPFCDVFYRLSVFLALLLPAGLVGHPLPGGQPPHPLLGPLCFALPDGHGGIRLASGMVPWLPVLLMVLREVVAGALRAMAATKGLILAARTSGKVKAWLQGVAICTILSWPALTFSRADWQLHWGTGAAWVCALASVVSILEYIWVNRGVLAQMAVRKR